MNVLLCLLLFFSLLGWLNTCSKYSRISQPRERIKIDTVYITDTVRDSIPKPQTRYVTRTDTVRIPNDTIYLDGDTIKIPVPIERKEYKTEDYFAIVEGYRPSLFYIETYNKTVYINKASYRRPRRWGFGVSAGYGTDFKTHYPYVGVGVNYNLISW